jgi:hypothetical protein
LDIKGGSIAGEIVEEKKIVLDENVSEEDVVSEVELRVDDIVDLVTSLTAAVQTVYMMYLCVRMYDTKSISIYISLPIYFNNVSIYVNMPRDFVTS